MSNIYQVAERAGVSPKTAARILAGQSLRSKSRDRVLEAARELGYVRNQQAANLRNGSSSMIGVVVPNIDNPFYGAVIQSMHDAFLERGFAIQVASSFGDSREEARALQTLQSYRVDGIFFSASEHPMSSESRKICSQMIHQGKPVVLGGVIENLVDGAEVVQLRNEEAVRKAIRYLVAQGHRRIGFLGGLAASRTVQARLEGYREGMAESDCPIQERFTIYAEGGPKSVLSQMLALLKNESTDERPTAFFAANDIIAISALKAFRELSLRVPEDIAIVGFDGIDLGELVTPSLTTLHQPMDTIARDVAELFESRVRGVPLTREISLIYEPELILRGSA
ncbi:LacI family DNA-binding transcriptional regulator [Puniceicoccus vermicola]|uniref:LacI family DNA-binding transcriptional regulator n=1 Tax=Puniceicoccus vermicola TaxID=388746 RepID=A0A7X1E4M4_9BACT|nr:LacI family DNA-binding transcriptional regulator [Puniceicoccus vermicola]MBC2602209.1 LacI family DNA-binding transcriptional regulator [Puniceicoccus vermicola]